MPSRVSSIETEIPNLRFMETCMLNASFERNAANPKLRRRPHRHTEVHRREDNEKVHQVVVGHPEGVSHLAGPETSERNGDDDRELRPGT